MDVEQYMQKHTHRIMLPPLPGTDKAHPVFFIDDNGVAWMYSKPEKIRIKSIDGKINKDVSNVCAMIWNGIDDDMRDKWLIAQYFDGVAIERFTK